MENKELAAFIDGDFSTWIQTIQEKLIINIVTTLIKTKPESATFQEHFNKVKDTSLKNWFKVQEELENPINKKLLKLQQLVLLETNDNPENWEENRKANLINVHSILAITQLKSIAESDKVKSDYSEILLKKNIDSVLKYFDLCIANKKYLVYNWHGSLLESMCYIVKDCSPMCNEAIKNYGKRVLEDIWCCFEINKMLSWELQIQILTELCSNFELCTSLLSIITSKMQYFTQCLNESADPIEKVSLIEKVPLFLSFAMCLLEKLKKTREKTVSKNKDFIEVTDLWKWSKSGGSDCQKQNEELLMLQRWLKICENLVVVCCELFPILGIQALEIKRCLESLIEDVASEIS